MANNAQEFERTDRALADTLNTKMIDPVNLAIAEFSDHEADAVKHITATERMNWNNTITNFATTVRATVLTGLSTATNAVITATDTILGALGKLQKQITDHFADNTQHSRYGTTTGSANTYALTLNPAATLVDGLCVTAKINATSTGAATINVNGTGAKPIISSCGLALTNGDLVSGNAYTMRYNGTSFVIQGGITALEKAAPGRYRNAGGLEDASLFDCIIKDGKAQLGYKFAGALTDNTNGGGTSGSWSYNYYGIVLNPTATGSKRVQKVALDVQSTPMPIARLVNRTTGQKGPWTAPRQGSFECIFSPNDIQYSSDTDIVEIQFLGTGTIYKATSLPSYVTKMVYYSDKTYSGEGTTISASACLYAHIYFYDSIAPAMVGDIIKTVGPADLEKWGSVKWEQETPTNSSVKCGLIEEKTSGKIIEANSGSILATINKHSGFKFAPAVNLAGIKVKAYPGASVFNLCILDSSKNLLKTIELEGEVNKNYTVLYDFIAGTSYYITIMYTNTGTNYASYSVAITFPVTNSLISLTGGLLNGVDNTTKIYNFSEITPITYLEENITSIKDLSDYDVANHPELSVKWQLSRTDPVAVPTVSDPSITYEGRQSDYPINYELIGKIKIDSFSVANTEFINVPTHYKHLKMICRNVTEIEVAAGDLLLFLYDEETSSSPLTCVTAGIYNATAWTGTATQIGYQFPTKYVAGIVGGTVEINIDQSVSPGFKALSINGVKDKVVHLGGGSCLTSAGRLTKIGLCVYASGYYSFGPGTLFELYGGN